MAIPKIIEELAHKVRTEIYGRDVREALASSMEATAEVAEWSREVAQQILDGAFDEAELITEIENKLNQLEQDYAPTLTSLENEIEDARGNEPSLGDRFSDIESKILLNEENINIEKTIRDGRDRELRPGLLKLPPDFPKIPFDIYKKRKFEFNHTAAPDNQHDWSTATEVFVQTLGNTDSSQIGTDRNEPISWAQFLARKNNNLYGNQTDFIITLVDDFLETDHFGANPLRNAEANLWIRNGTEKGITWIGRFIKQGDSTMPSPWTLVSGRTYKCGLSSNINCVPSNYNNLDIFGLPLVYKKVDSISEVNDTEGSYFIEGNEVYVHLYKGESVEDIHLDRSNKSMDASDIGNYTIMFENIGFNFAEKSFSGTSTEESVFYFFNCKFNRDRYSTLPIDKKYKVFVLDCHSNYPSEDGFNYHATDVNSLAVEINSVCVGAGKHKLPGGNTGQGSNNGSTAHDGMYVLRVNGTYVECEGPVVADVGNCYSVTVECQSYDILPSTTGTKAGFYFQNPSGISESEEKPKYIIGCKMSGAFFDFGIASVRSSKTYFQGFEGIDKVWPTGIPELIYWDEVTSQ